MHQLALRVRRDLIVQPPQRAADRAGEVVLHELRPQASRVEPRRLPGLQEVTARITKHARRQDLQPRNECLLDLHRRLSLR